MKINHGQKDCYKLVFHNYFSIQLNSFGFLYSTLQQLVLSPSIMLELDFTEVIIRLFEEQVGK